MRSAAVILAAGGSVRMSRGNKLLMSLRGRPLLLWSVESALKSSLDYVYVVIGCNAEESAKRLPRGVETVYNPGWRGGMSTSIRAGIAALQGDVEIAVIIPADQPLIKSSTLDGLVDKVKIGAGIAYLSLSGDVRSPAAFRRRYFGELLAISGDVGAKSVIMRNIGEALALEAEMEELMDIDTEEDLIALEAILAAKEDVP